MNLFSISLRNIRIRKVSSVLTMVGTVVATGLYAAILLMISQTDAFYRGSISGYQAIIGPKDASQLEICLNTIFNVGAPPGLIRTEVYQQVRDGMLGERTDVRFCVPQARGDTFSPQNYPVIGTTDEFIAKFVRKVDGEEFPLRFREGACWQFGHDDFLAVCGAIAAKENEAVLEGKEEGDPIPLEPGWKKAVIGSRVARVLGIGIGTKIVPVHGRAEELGSHAHDEAACEVCGILAPTNSPIDSSIYVPICVQLLLGGHRAVQPKAVLPGQLPPEYEAGDILISAALADPLDHVGGMILRRALAGNPYGQCAWPQDVVPKFLRTIGSISDALSIVAWLVLVVAAVSIAVSMYNTMNERRREIAIMRSLGARRLQISLIILLEAVLLSFLGAFLGVLACHGAAWAGQATVEDLTGVHMDWTAFSVDEVYLILLVTLLGALAGILPAAKGSLTQVADNLAPLS